MKESYGQEIPPNPSSNQEIPESVVQLSGQLLSTQEFKEQTQLDLFCGEKIPEGSPTQNHVINDLVPKEDTTEESLNNTSVGNQMTINVKTYSRLNGMMSTTMDAATGLVMLSTPVVRPKLKRRSFIQMSFAERLRLKRERNRIAAKKCRQKKLEKIEFLEKRKEVLLKENHGYEEYLTTQRQRLFELKTLLFSHRLTECRLPRNYI